MPDYQFSAIKIVPQSAGREPVAVGVILYDPKRGEIYRRFTDNWDEVRRRTGLATLPDIRSITEEGPIKVGDGYLADLSANQFPDTLLVTRPNNLMPFDTPHGALEWVFEAHVGLPPRTVDDAAPSSRRADALLGDRITAMGFAAGSHRHMHEFLLGSLRIRFPHVFLKDGVPRDALFAASVGSRSAASAIRSRIGDIASIQRWCAPGIAFKMCATESRHDAETAGSAVRESMKLLDKWGVGVVYWDGIGDALAEIKDGVSPVPVARLG